jgi:hypothetical protein
VAKISARGAIEILRLKTRSKSNHDYTYEYLLTSDGRVLVKSTGTFKSGWTLLGSLPASQQTAGFMREIVRKHGREVV